jgi:hypothetical protein
MMEVRKKIIVEAGKKSRPGYGKGEEGGRGQEEKR